MGNEIGSRPTTTPDFNALRKGAKGLDDSRTLRFNADNSLYAHKGFVSRALDIVLFRNSYSSNVKNAVTVAKQSFAETVGKDFADAAFKKLGIKNQITAGQMRELNKLAHKAKDNGVKLPTLKASSDFAHAVGDLPPGVTRHFSNENEWKSDLSKIATQFLNGPKLGGSTQDWNTLRQDASRINQMSVIELNDFQSRLENVAVDARATQLDVASTALSFSTPTARVRDRFEHVYGPELTKEAFQGAGIDPGSKTVSPRQLHALKQFERGAAAFHKDQHVSENPRFLKESDKMKLLEPSDAKDRQLMLTMHKQNWADMMRHGAETQINIKDNNFQAMQKFAGQDTLSEDDAKQLKAEYHTADARMHQLMGSVNDEFARGQKSFGHAVRHWNEVADQQAIAELKKKDPNMFQVLSNLGMLQEAIRPT
ncbi:MAG: hypothetical protein AAFU66_02710 [Pseudomonadota bacterium]